MKLAFKLTGVLNMPADVRHAAQQRFGSLLVEVFGGEDGVWKRYQAAQAAASAGPAEGAAGAEAGRDIARWREAATVAARLALGSYANDPTAVFEISQVGDSGSA